MRRGASDRQLEGFAAANYAIWLWKTKGKDAALQELGPFSSCGLQADWLEEACWMPRGDDPTEPLGYGDLALVAVGMLRLPYCDQVHLSPSESVEINVKAAEAIDATLVGTTPAEAVRRFMEAYPITDPARRERMRSFVLREVELSRDELQEEFYAFAVMLCQLRGLPPGSITPQQLHAEWMSGRRRS